MEMKVIIDEYQLPQELKFNFEELKTELQAKAKEYEVMTYTEEQLKNANTGAKVFVSGGVQFQDAMEDLQLSLTM